MALGSHLGTLRPTCLSKQERPDMSITPSRRTVLAAVAGFVVSAAGAGLSKDAWSAGVAATKQRAVALRSLHTGERLDIVYWADGAYLPAALAQVDYILRDWRTGDVHPIDPKLLDILHDLHRLMDGTEPYTVISGYRSPATNAMLANRSNGVARRSLHLKGMAIDVSLPNRSLAALRKTALAMRRGGVGYYTKPGFVHLDTGRVRSWGS